MQHGIEIHSAKLPNIQAGSGQKVETRASVAEQAGISARQTRDALRVATEIGVGAGPNSETDALRVETRDGAGPSFGAELGSSVPAEIKGGASPNSEISTTASLSERSTAWQAQPASNRPASKHSNE